MESELRTGPSKFVIADDPRCSHLSVEEMEKRLFGYHRPNNKEQDLTDADFIPIKS